LRCDSDNKMELNEKFCVGVIFTAVNGIYNHAVKGKVTSTGEALALAASACAIYVLVKLCKEWSDSAMESAEKEEEGEEE